MPPAATPHPSALPVAPSLQPLLQAEASEHQPGRVRPRTLFILLLAVLIGAAAALVAQLLLALIGLITHLSFFGRIGWTLITPAPNTLGAWVIAVPVVGALIVGAMARWGSPAIRGHGIPEAMEQVLTNRSRIAPRVLFLKPLSAAISIGTGGPFGAEGPIIATGGALGSVVGQFVPITAQERKVLLAAGAAAGMAAVFGTPLAAVLLAVELLLFEFSPASLLPVIAACASAEVVRALFEGFHPFFAVPALAWPHAAALIACAPLGAVVGLAAVLITRTVYAVEDAFDHLPLHWMWWPAIGALAVGLIGWWQPRTLGVGYDNITDAIAGGVLGPALWLLGAAKLVSWTLALGSGTSGGTLAPLMTVGACLGAGLGHATAALFPQLGMAPELAGLVGMAAIFAGSSRALFMSVVFVLESTWQLPALLPLLIACGAAFLVSSLLMRETIMTEKIARRGVRVPDAYHADPLAHTPVRRHASRNPVSLRADDTLGHLRVWLDSGEPGSTHQGYAVLDAQGHVLGLLTRKDVGAVAHADAATPLAALLRKPPVCIAAEESLAVALHHMLAHDIGRLPVVDTEGRLVGILTRSDLLAAWRESLLDRVHRGR